MFLNKMVNKLKKELILFSFVLLLTLVIGLVYAQNQSNGNGNQMNKTRMNMTHTFVPWQKNNESECPTACACQGAVVSCETDTGKIMTITAGNSGNVITIVVDDTKVNTTLKIEQESDNETNKSTFHAEKSNGKNSEIKIMPDVAAQMALGRLKLKVCTEENNCTIVLKEVGNDKNETDNKTIAYEIQVQRHARILGIFQAKADERAEVNAENGIVKVHEPWWMFLATKED
jgi:hypothetical protein